VTPIGQPCTCEPMTWLYFVFVQSLFVFVGQILVRGVSCAAHTAGGALRRVTGGPPLGDYRRALRGGAVQDECL
jgi:hypothetical protein